jgi:hypothetical protein
MLRPDHFPAPPTGEAILASAIGEAILPSPQEAIAEPSAVEARAVAEIRKLGGLVTVREETPGRPAVGVSLTGGTGTDAVLHDLKDHLRGLTQLQTLDLLHSQVTDAGLEHLKGLTNLKRLGLGQTKVTDAGVKDLQKALPKCEISR